MFDQYINLTDIAPASLAQLTLSFVFAIYFLRLKNKSKDTRLFLFWLFCEVLLYSGMFLTNALNAKSQLYQFAGTYYGPSIFLDNLVWALLPYYLGKNHFPKERIIMTVLITILYLCAMILTVVYGYSNSIAQYIFILISIYVPTVFYRKMKMAAKYNEGKRTEKVMYGFCIVSILAVASLFVSFYFFATPTLVLTLSYFVTNLANSLYANFTFINYSRERNSLVAKLVGVVLCSALIVLGLVPILIINQEQYFDAEATQEILRTFTLAIPVTCILMVFLIPVLFKYGFLNPFKKVVAAVEKINGGDLSIDIDVEVNDEIGQMAMDVKGMADSLKMYSTKLELLVEKRTKELEDSLTKLKSTQAQLIQSEKMASLGELTAGIAHEIQNPLNFVNNFSDVNKEMLEELKAERLKPNAERDEDLQNDLINDVIGNEEKINHHGKRAEAIVKGMLQHSRTSSGQKELTDINALADEYLRLSYHGLRAKDKTFSADFKTEFDENIGSVNIIPQDIGRVLLNLYNNAFYAVNERQKAEGEGFKAAVSVTTKKVKDRIEISVADNGNGIPQKIVEKIFQPFFTTKPTGQGTGLGLSLSYDIVKAHGGEIKVESKEGEGSEFIIQLQVV